MRSVCCRGASGPALGPMSGADYHEGSVRLEPGDIVLFYTDGLVERRGWGIQGRHRRRASPRPRDCWPIGIGHTAVACVRILVSGTGPTSTCRRRLHGGRPDRPAGVVTCTTGEEALAGGIHRCRLPFLDVSVGLAVGPDAVLLIDCGTTLSEAERLADDIIELAGRPVNSVVLTHHHFDHILGSSGFPGAQLTAPPPVTVALTSGVDALREHAVGYGASPDEVDRTVATIAGTRPRRQQHP